MSVLNNRGQKSKLYVFRHKHALKLHDLYLQAYLLIHLLRLLRCELFQYKGGLLSHFYNLRWEDA